MTNEFAGSDGDIFPAAVQLEGLAPIIGVRSWGGVVGIRGDKRLVDGGFLTEVMALHGQRPPIKPDFGPARPRGRDAYVEELTAD